MVEDRKSTAKEELKWRAEFETLGREAVRAKSSDFRPYIKRDLAVRWLREQELARFTCRDSVGAPYGMGRVIWLGWQRAESWCRQAM